VGMKAGAAKRFCNEPPPIDDEWMVGLETFVGKWIRTHLVPLAADSDVSIEAWLAKTNYTQARKDELLLKWKANPDMTLKRNQLVKMFLKDEGYPEYKYPRGINSRVDEFKCATGPIFKLIEEAVFKLDYFIKKIPVSDRPAYIQKKLGHGIAFLATDYRSYEASFRRKLMMSCEGQMYRYMTGELPDGEFFMKLFDTVIAGMNTICNKYFKIILEATRMSGEMNTSLGNGFSNLMIMLYVSERVGATEVDGVVEGDDGLFTMLGPIPQPCHFAKLGMDIKLEIHEMINTASFCGLIYDSEDLINITDPMKVLSNTGWTTRQYFRSRDLRKKELLKCKALSILYQYDGCPILMDYAQWILRNLVGVRARVGQCNTYERDMYKQALEKVHYMTFVPKIPGVGTRLLLQEKFKITVEHQIRLEHFFRSSDMLTPIHNSLLSIYVPHDWEHFYRHYVRNIDVTDKLLLEPAFGDTAKAGHEIRIVVTKGIPIPARLITSGRGRLLGVL
jgi:hypothetical protein